MITRRFAARHTVFILQALVVASLASSSCSCDAECVAGLGEASAESDIDAEEHVQLLQLGVSVERVDQAKQAMPSTRTYAAVRRAVEMKLKVTGTVLISLTACLLLAKMISPQSTVVTGLCLAFTYNVLSACMIETNKWLMLEEHYPFPVMLTLHHMIAATVFTNCLRLFYPAAFPALQKLDVSWSFLAKFVPLGCMFASSIVCSNAAYQYLSVPLLQIMKQCNIVVIYTLSVFCGLDSLTRCSIVLLLVILAGTTMAVAGEIHFNIIGFILQLGSSWSEAGKVVTQGLLMAGSTKLDPLTLVFFMAPASLLANIVPFCVMEGPQAAQIITQFSAHFPVIFLNASTAVALNVVVAMCIRYFSPTGYLVMGLIKDIVIISTSPLFLGETLTPQQVCGLLIGLCGVGAYSLYRQNINFFVEDHLITGFARLCGLEGLPTQSLEPSKTKEDERISSTMKEDDIPGEVKVKTHYLRPDNR